MPVLVWRHAGGRATADLPHGRARAGGFCHSRFFFGQFHEEVPISLSKTNKSAARTANGVFEAWEKRTALVKLQMNAESAASDAKTARLRALRLAKEAEDSEAARIAAANAPPTAAKKRARRDG